MVVLDNEIDDSGRNVEPGQSGVLLEEARSLFRQEVPLLASTADAVSARGLYLGFTDQLHVDSFTMRKTLESLKSPVARQLVATMDEFKAGDWQYLRTSRMSALEVGWYHQASRQISYVVPRLGVPAFLLGAVSSPIQRVTPVLAHEVGHHSGPLYGPMPSSSTAKPELKEKVAKACLVSETRAQLIEIHITDELKVNQELNLERKAALKSGTLGARIMSSYELYAPGLKHNEGLANKVVADFLRDRLPNVVDPATGAVRPFDIHMPEPVKGSVAANPRECTIEIPYKAARTMLSAPGSIDSKGKSVAIRGAKALTALGAFVAVTDVYGEFQKDNGSGFGRLAKVATEWGGFEVASFLARSNTERLFERAPKSRCALVLGIGMLGAYGAGKLIGEDLENGLKKGINEQKHPLSLKDYH